MAFDIEYFNKINNSYNTSTKKDVQLHQLKAHINNHFTDTIDCYRVPVNNIEQDLIITRTTNHFIKSIKARPYEDFNVGDYVTYEKDTWLVIEKDLMNQEYSRGKMKLCNYTLKFQNQDGIIFSYPCITSDTTFSENANQTIISLGENKKSILLPFDESTSLLSVGKRMYVDKRANPTPYKIIGDIDTTTYNYSDKGLIYFIMEQDLIENSSQYPDRPDLGICNYFESTITPPLLPESEKYSVITSSNANNQITIGSTSGRTLTPKFYKDNIEVADIVAVWAYELPIGYENQFTITSVVGTNKVKIVAKDNTSLVGKTVTATVGNELSEYQSSITLTVVSGF